ncbi:nucleobase:cation symporter-1 [Vigna unguiculata]|uniref:Nucleobase:cation symporter-1 n=1 Tax=Vigna unguiculata TaxID=3917 RepID=A0A4D6M3G7_VIGUN|nr:nucleobase:cation symporter-1 [Vigna unguiculata]
MIRRPSIYLPTLFQSFSNSAFTEKTLLSSSSSSSSSSILITLHDSHSKRTLSPFYNLLPPTQNPNNIVNLISSILKHKSSHLSLLQNNDIKGILPHLGPHAISRVLLRCQSDHTSALTFFNWVKKDLNITPTVHNYCVLLHILAWSRVFPQAMELLSELIQTVEVECVSVSSNEDIYENLVACTEDCNWNPVIFDMLVKAYVKIGMVEKGLETFRRNIESCFIPNVIACNCLLSGLSRFNYITQCWEVYEEMGKLGVHRNAYTFNIMTHVLCKDGDTDKVNGFLEKMEEEGFEPDLVTYNTLVNSYCRKKRLEDAFYLYKIMYVRGVMPNLITYTTLMNGLCEEGKIKEAHQLFHQMIHRGIDPDIVSYNTLVCGYCRQGKMQMCRSILYEMIGNKISPDSITCRIIVDGYVRDGKLVSALNTVEELKKFRIKIPEEVYDYLVVALCKEGKPFAARSFLHRIISQDGYIPKMNTYNKLVESLCGFNNVEETLALKSEMEKKNMKVNIVAYRALISCLCRVKRTLEAEGLLEEIMSSGMLPDVEICRALIKGYCEENKVDKAVFLLKLFAKEFQVYDNESYNAVVKVFCDVGNVTELMEIQDKLLKVGYVPNKLTCRYVIHGLQKAMEVDDEILNHG